MDYEKQTKKLGAAKFEKRHNANESELSALLAARVVSLEVLPCPFCREMPEQHIGYSDGACGDHYIRCCSENGVKY